MGDPFGNLSGGDIATAYSAYQTGKRAAPFVKGTIDAAQGAFTGGDIGALASGGRSLTAAVGTAAARTAVGQAALEAGAGIATKLGATAAAGAISGVAEGAALGSVVPGVGTLIGAAAGAVAPFILPHIPVVGDAVNKIPLIGGMLSPKKKSAPKASGGSNYVAPSPFTATGAEYSAGQRAQYAAGRGFRR